MRLVLLVLLAAVTLTAAPAVHARSAVIPTRSVSDLLSVRFMGEEVVWVERAARGRIRLVRAGAADRAPRAFATLGPRDRGSPRAVRLDASATRVAVSARFGEERLLRAGAPGDLRRIASQWWDLDGDRVLLPGAEPDTALIVDPLTGESAVPRLTTPYGRLTSMALAGDLVAYAEGCCGRVVDWRTGETVVEASSGDMGWVVGLQPDAVALWGSAHSDSLGYGATVGPHHLGSAGLTGAPLPLLGAGRIAYDDADRAAVVVTDLRGGVSATSPLPANAAPAQLVDHRPPWFRLRGPGRLSDFDGRRALWSYTPCAVALVAVWDIGSGPMRSPRPRCPSARLAGRVRWAGPAALRVPLRCSGARLTGCPLRLGVRGRRRHVRVDMAPGERRTVRLRVPRAGRVTVVARPALRPAAGQRRVWRVAPGPA